jgi:protein TonB
MFGNLVESGAHHVEARRRGKYFLGTVVFYCLLLAAFGIGSIYAYDARLRDRSDYELVAMMRFNQEQPARTTEPERANRPRAAGSATQRMVPVRVPEFAVNSPYLRNRPMASAETRALSPRISVIIDPNGTNLEFEPGGSGLAGNEGPSREPGGGGPGPIVVERGTPPPVPVRPTPTPTPTPRQDRPVTLSSSVISGKALEKPAPPYPATARQMGAQGSVPVLIVVDEQGRVISAKASGGHPLLQQAAVQAAYRARFEPTRLSGQAVKVTGVITYNFILQR